MGASFASFMSTFTGRAIRIAAGLGLMLAGYRIGGVGGLALGGVGAIPAAAGVFNFCLIAPLIRAPFWGREALSSKH